jgi:hypothetical protein
MKKLWIASAATAVFCMLVTTAVMADEPTGQETISFTSTAPSSWAAADVEEMIKLGVVPDRLQGDYTKEMTREDYAELSNLVLMKLTGKEELLDRVLLEEEFTDTFSKPIHDVYKFGIVNGVTLDTFEPDRRIVRQEAAVMMANILNTVRVPELSDKQSPFADREAISGWAQEAADTCYNADIFQGSGTGMEPYSPYTREQSIVTMKRLLQYSDKVEGISYRGKIFVKFEDIDDVRTGFQYVKLGSPKSKARFTQYWQSVAGNFKLRTAPAESGTKVTDGEFTIETGGPDYLIKISWSEP